MSHTGWIGIDVGGANLKAARGDGYAVSLAFPLWREPDRLAEELRNLIARVTRDRDISIALTMTGELADCYATKAEGVRAIVQATASAAPGAAVRVASLDDRWLSVEEAFESPTSAAAANWRLAARLVAKLRPTGAGVWIDTGSTTTDVVPIDRGAVVSRGQTDTERLLGGELIYTGVRRTPVCAIVDRLPYRGEPCPVAAELFADAGDAWLLLGEIPEDPADAATADGRPRTSQAAIVRLARCVCADSTSFQERDARSAARAIAEKQTESIRERLPERAPDWGLVSGEGEFLARRAAEAAWPGFETRSLGELIGREASRGAPAYAAATLAAEECGDTF